MECAFFADGMIPYFSQADEGQLNLQRTRTSSNNNILLRYNVVINQNTLVFKSIQYTDTHNIVVYYSVCLLFKIF